MRPTREQVAEMLEELRSSSMEESEPFRQRILALEAELENVTYLSRELISALAIYAEDPLQGERARSAIMRAGRFL